VVATGTAPLSYQWSENGSNINGATSASYTTPATAASDNGATFIVTVTNNAGSIASNPATLTVNAAVSGAPAITTQPANQTVAVGSTATFSVVATGTAPLSYQWSKNGGAISGATSASYTTPAIVASDNGATFTVTVTNSTGSITSSTATLTVNAVVSGAPAITTQPANQTVAVGSTATFSVVATGTAPLSYQWFKNTVSISGATSASYTTPATAASDTGAEFTVTVSNALGSASSNQAKLTVSASTPTVTAVYLSSLIGAKLYSSELSPSGTDTLIGGLNVVVNGIPEPTSCIPPAVTPAGKAYTVGTGITAPYSLNLGNAVLTQIGTSIPPNITDCIASDNNGNLFATAQGGVYSVDPTTGVFTLIGAVPGGVIAFDSNNLAWAIAGGSVTLYSLVTWNPATGAVIPTPTVAISGLPVGASPMFMAFANGVLYIFCLDSTIYSVNTNTGQATFIRDLTFTPS
jgi:hypothetical protein